MLSFHFLTIDKFLHNTEYFHICLWSRDNHDSPVTLKIPCKFQWSTLPTSDHTSNLTQWRQTTKHIIPLHVSAHHLHIENRSKLFTRRNLQLHWSMHESAADFHRRWKQLNRLLRWKHLRWKTMADETLLQFFYLPQVVPLVLLVLWTRNPSGLYLHFLDK